MAFSPLDAARPGRPDLPMVRTMSATDPRVDTILRIHEQIDVSLSAAEFILVTSRNRRPERRVFDAMMLVFRKLALALPKRDVWGSSDGFFSLASESIVRVSGTEYESYHHASYELSEQVLSSVWSAIDFRSAYGPSGVWPRDQKEREPSFEVDGFAWRDVFTRLRGELPEIEGTLALYLKKEAQQAISKLPPLAAPPNSAVLTELLTKEQIANLFGVGKNQAGAILDAYCHERVAGRYRMRIEDMPPKYFERNQRPAT